MNIVEILKRAYEWFKILRNLYESIMPVVNDKDKNPADKVQETLEIIIARAEEFKKTPTDV